MASSCPDPEHTEHGSRIIEGLQHLLRSLQTGRTITHTIRTPDGETVTITGHELGVATDQSQYKEAADGLSMPVD